MGQYKVGPSRVHLNGHKDACEPGCIVEHDFSITGPEGEHGPAREAAMVAAGALTPVTEKDTREGSSARRRQDVENA